MSHHLKLVCLLPACNQLLCCQRRTNGFPGTGGGMSKLSRLLCLMLVGMVRDLLIGLFITASIVMVAALVVVSGVGQRILEQVIP